MGWTKFEDSRPDLGARVIAWMESQYGSGCVGIVTYDHKAEEHIRIIRRDGQWWNNGRRITHWMPLPESPK